MASEQRKFDRLSVQLPARVSPLEPGATGVKGTITNLGPEGAFCIASELLPQGAPVRISFGIADMDVSVNAEGIVRWVSRAGERQGIGIHFTRISPDQRDAIYRYILIKHAEARRLL